MAAERRMAVHFYSEPKYLSESADGHATERCGRNLTV